MARAPLRSCSPGLSGPALSSAILSGTVSVLTATGSAANVYADATSSTTLTSTAVRYSPTASALEGWVEPGEYIIRTNAGFDWPVEVDAGDGASGPNTYVGSILDPTVSSQNFPYNNVNSMAATTTSQLAKFVRFVPSAPVTAAKVVSASGAAIATITGSFVGLYTSDGTTLTRVAVNSTNTSSGLWDTANTLYRQALNPATTLLSPGTVYYVGMLVNATTPGAHMGWVKVANQPVLAATEVPVPMYTLAGQTSLPASQAIAGLTSAFDLVPWVAVTS